MGVHLNHRYSSYWNMDPLGESTPYDCKTLCFRRALSILTMSTLGPKVNTHTHNLLWALWSLRVSSLIIVHTDQNVLRW